MMSDAILIKDRNLKLDEKFDRLMLCKFCRSRSLSRVRFKDLVYKSYCTGKSVLQSNEKSRRELEINKALKAQTFV